MSALFSHMAALFSHVMEFAFTLYKLCVKNPNFSPWMYAMTKSMYKLIEWAPRTNKSQKYWYTEVFYCWRSVGWSISNKKTIFERCDQKQRWDWRKVRWGVMKMSGCFFASSSLLHSFDSIYTICGSTTRTKTRSVIGKRSSSSKTCSGLFWYVFDGFWWVMSKIMTLCKWLSLTGRWQKHLNKSKLWR